MKTSPWIVLIAFVLVLYGTGASFIEEFRGLPLDAVIGYRSGANGLRDLLLAAMVDGKPAFVGTVELGIRGGSDLLKWPESLRIPRPAVPCSISAHWVVPELCCTVRFCGWRPGGFWRDAVLLRWEEVPLCIGEEYCLGRSPTARGSLVEGGAS